VRECFKGDEASPWKRPKFDSRAPKTLNPIFTKIGRRNYVLDGTQHATFCSHRCMGFRYPDTWFCLPLGWL